MSNTLLKTKEFNRRFGVKTAPVPLVAAENNGSAEVPGGKEVRGFALYVGVTAEQLAAGGTELADLVAKLKSELAKLAPAAQSYAAVALAPTGSGGRDVDIARLALGEPAARLQACANTGAVVKGVTVDLSRRRVAIDGEQAQFTFREFALLRHLLTNVGVTVTREEIIENVWAEVEPAAAPTARAIDVYVRRLRAKLGEYQDIICTIRGRGYRLESSPLVRVNGSSGVLKDFRSRGIRSF